MVSRSSPLDIEGRIDKSQWKLEHCVNCLFYECELVNEYLQYKKNYINDSKPVEVIKRPALPENQERREQWERLREEDAEHGLLKSIFLADKKILLNLNIG